MSCEGRKLSNQATVGERRRGAKRAAATQTRAKPNVVPPCLLPVCCLRRQLSPCGPNPAKPQSPICAPLWPYLYQVHQNYICLFIYLFIYLFTWVFAYLFWFFILCTYILAYFTSSKPSPSTQQQHSTFNNAAAELWPKQRNFQIRLT